MTKTRDIIWLESVDSTNEEAKRRLLELDNLSVLSVIEQKSGKGQRYNKWLSEAGKNLLFTVVLKLSGRMIDAQKQFAISQITAESVVGLLDKYDIEAWIKLPNDIYVQDRKICGILIENGLRGTNLEYSIIGVGINVNQVEFDPSLPNPISMSLLTGDDYNLAELLNEFLELFEKKLNTILS